jgi:hypothetical protein
VAGIHGRSFAAHGTLTSGDFHLMDGVPNALAAKPAGNVVAVFNTAYGRIVARQFTSP